jgi:hypothetical protein
MERKLWKKKGGMRRSSSIREEIRPENNQKMATERSGNSKERNKLSDEWVPCAVATCQELLSVCRVSWLPGPGPLPLSLRHSVWGPCHGGPTCHQIVICCAKRSVLFGADEALKGQLLRMNVVGIVVT